MKELIWDQSLSVQVKEIDEDHRRLVELFNLLLHAVEEGDTTEYVEALLEELLSCTNWHFKHEERLMLKYSYAHADAHKREHRSLIESAKALQQKFIAGGRMISAEEIEFLEQWLTGHIFGADMEMGVYLGEVM
ncbi:MAG: hemerythrin family protein [Gammaproteobacteria bacterium]|nr:hemerythrin family protein [Gammaproteobacteria bacterium]MBT4605475.1 hemerythrin family protein [Thiotrichales bacterium]MBT3473378.1 hemerythrin family protein [Gammaproteobacteria bacterium]MBT3967435.1 hemerythrin family protein [Gammaproteobacteria bacterium]MBT4080671.1 hemerythrin family protein [Gammaproteobacteria bacterium]